MNLVDVDALVIVDFKGNLLIKKVYNIEDSKLERIIKKCSTDKDPIFVYEDHLVLCHKEQELITILISYLENNEVFLGQCFDQFNIALKHTLKKCNKEYVHKKYDVVFLLMDIFVYQGIISENKSEKMLEKLPKRSFEATDGMKVPKGLASVIYKTSKSLGGYL